MSTMSASAPAGSASRNIGRLEATCTSETSNGSTVNSVISQPAAAPYIHQPMLVTTVAVHSTAYEVLRSGVNADVCDDVVAPMIME